MRTVRFSAVPAKRLGTHEVRYVGLVGTTYTKRLERARLNGPMWPYLLPGNKALSSSEFPNSIAAEMRMLGNFYVQRLRITVAQACTWPWDGQVCHHKPEEKAR